MELIPPEAYISLAKALTHGADKHGVGNWKQVGKDRFQGALMRHYTAYMLDNQSIDEDTGLKHAELMLCNAMFLSWFETQENKEILI